MPSSRARAAPRRRRPGRRRSRSGRRATAEGRVSVSASRTPGRAPSAAAGSSWTCRRFLSLPRPCAGSPATNRSRRDPAGVGGVIEGRAVLDLREECVDERGRQQRGPAAGMLHRADSADFSRRDPASRRFPVWTPAEGTHPANISWFTSHHPTVFMGRGEVVPVPRPVLKHGAEGARTARVRRASLLCAALMLTACGSGHASHSGSIPITTVTPSGTTTYGVASSAMEPTLHCARPAQGCERSVSDRIVVRRPPGDLKRGDILVFQTPPLAARECGAGGLFVKRVIGLPGDSLGGTAGLRLRQRQEVRRALHQVRPAGRPHDGVIRPASTEHVRPDSE